MNTRYPTHTCSDVGELFWAELPLIGRFRLLGELFGYLDVSRAAMISDRFSS